MCKRITWARCRRNPESREDRIPQAAKYRDTITADHKVANEENGSRLPRRCAVVVNDSSTQWIHSYPCRNKTAQDTKRNVQRFLLQEFIGVHKKVRRSVFQSWQIYSTSTRNRRNHRKSGQKGNRMDFGSVGPIRIGWMNSGGRSDGMSLFLTKHSRFTSRWENSLRKKIRHTIPWAFVTLRNRDVLSSTVHKRQKQAPSAQKSSKVFCWICFERGRWQNGRSAISLSRKRSGISKQ